MPVYQIPPLYLRIYQTGRIMYSARVNYDVSCPMKFEDYPVDIQHCDIEFESWGHTSDILKFFWIEDDVTINENITLSQHTFYVELIDDDSSSSFSTGSFSKIKMRIHLVRQITFHALRTYLPSLFFILVAWFSMFVPLNHVPGRVTMSMTTLLTLSTMFNSLTTVTPPISYTTKLDKWMVFCIIFVFATLLEFTVVIFLKYYLRHLPVFQVDNVFSNPDSATITRKMDQKKIFDVRRQLANWIQKEATEKQDFVKVLKIKAKKDQRPVQADLDDSSDDDDSGSEDERKAIISRTEASEKIIKKIEKWSVILYLTAMVISIIIFAYDLIKTYEGTDENGKILNKTSMES
eukprot:02503.XXX_15798_14050_1 [CDS] Oithona nana genome sequencing.